MKGGPAHRVSVVIPCHNWGANWPRLRDAIRSQTYPHYAEYILVDNNSTDASVSLVAPDVVKLKSEGLNVRLMHEDRIQSSYAARNTGIRSATADIVAFTDTDCVPEPDWLEQLVHGFRDPHLLLAAGKILAAPPTTILEDFADLFGILSARNAQEHSYLPFAQTANMAVRRVVFERIGLFRPHLQSGGDADFCWRFLHDHPGQRISYLEKAVIRHLHRRTWRELGEQFVKYGRGHYVLHKLHGVPLPRKSPLLAHGPWLQLATWICWSLPREVVRCLVASRDYRRGRLIQDFASVYCAWCFHHGVSQRVLPANFEAIERL